MANGSLVEARLIFSRSGDLNGLEFGATVSLPNDVRQRDGHDDPAIAHDDVTSERVRKPLKDHAPKVPWMTGLLKSYSPTSRRGGINLPSMIAVPSVGPDEPFAKWNSRLPSHRLDKRNVEQFSRHAVWLTDVVA